MFLTPRAGTSAATAKFHGGVDKGWPKKSCWRKRGVKNCRGRTSRATIDFGVTGTLSLFP